MDQIVAHCSGWSPCDRGMRGAYVIRYLFRRFSDYLKVSNYGVNSLLVELELLNVHSGDIAFNARNSRAYVVEVYACVARRRHHKILTASFVIRSRNIGFTVPYSTTSTLLCSASSRSFLTFRSENKV